MQLAIIAPLEYLFDLCPLGTIELCFAHMMRDDGPYCRYYTEASLKKRPMILDNGIMELGSAMDSYNLLEVAKKLRPTFLTPPEYLHDAEATIDGIEAFLPAFDKSGLFPQTQLLAACHGNSLESWLTCYERLCELPYIARIGIPYDLQFDTDLSESSQITDKWLLLSQRRLNLCQVLSTHGIARDVHLFGLAHASELPRQAKHPFIKSNDSSLTVMSALDGHLFSDKSWGPKNKPFINWHTKYRAKLAENARHNIRFISEKLL